MSKNLGLKRYFDEQDRQEFLSEMRKNGFDIVENNVPDMRKSNTSGYLDKVGKNNRVVPVTSRK